MLFKGFSGLRLQLKQLDFLQIFTRDIVYYAEFLRGFTIAHVELFSSGMVAVQVLARGFEDVEKGDIGGFTRGTVRPYITGFSPVGQFDKSGS